MNLKYILIIVILAVFVGGGIITYQYWLAPKGEIKPPEVKIPGEVPPIDETTIWKTYNNPEASFTFKYPSDWEVKQDSPVTQTTGFNRNNDSVIARLFLEPVFAQTIITVPGGIITLPDGFEVKADYLYETPAGYKAHTRTITIGPIGSPESIIVFNMRQFSCHGFPEWPDGLLPHVNSQNFRQLPPFHKIQGTDIIVGENFIATCYTARAVLDIFDEIVESFEAVPPVGE